MVRWIDGSMDRWIDGSMVRWFDGSMVRWFDGSMVRWEDLSGFDEKVEEGLDGEGTRGFGEKMHVAVWREDACGGLERRCMWR
jgi:hypothetical protein